MGMPRNNDYSEALKAALVLRRAGTIPPQVDYQLGLIARSLAEWAIGEAIIEHKLWHELGEDEDFKSNVITAIISYFDKVSLDREPKEILVYLKRVGRSSINDQIDYMNAKKRQHEDVQLDGAIIYSDFYGEPDGVGYSIELDSKRSRDK